MTILEDFAVTVWIHRFFVKLQLLCLQSVLSCSY